MLVEISGRSWKRQSSKKEVWESNSSFFKIFFSIKSYQAIKIIKIDSKCNKEILSFFKIRKDILWLCISHWTHLLPLLQWAPQWFVGDCGYNFLWLEDTLSQF